MTETSSSTALKSNRTTRRAQRQGSRVFAGVAWGVALACLLPMVAVAIAALTNLSAGGKGEESGK